MKKELGYDVVKACSSAVSVSLCETVCETAAADSELNMSTLISNSTDEIQVFHSSVRPCIEVNDVPIGSAAVPAELIRVSYQGRSVFVQVMYDEGSQISLVTKY